MAMCKDVWFMDSGINVVGKVERNGVPKLVDTKYGASKKVCGAFLKDETGEIRLTLWDSDVERIQNGYTIKIRNGIDYNFWLLCCCGIIKIHKVFIISFFRKNRKIRSNFF